MNLKDFSLYSFLTNPELGSIITKIIKFLEKIFVFDNHVCTIFLQLKFEPMHAIMWIHVKVKSKVDGYQALFPILTDWVFKGGLFSKVVTYVVIM